MSLLIQLPNGMWIDPSHVVAVEPVPRIWLRCRTGSSVGPRGMTTERKNMKPLFSVNERVAAHFGDGTPFTGTVVSVPVCDQECYFVKPDGYKGEIPFLEHEIKKASDARAEL